LTSCTFIRNWANEGGGGGICNSNSNLSLTNCTFDRNWAGEGGGGGICNIGSRTELINCTLTGNSTEGNGGGICNYAEGTTSLTNCTITNNRANEYGGGIHCNSVIATFTNCILWGNSASIGDEIAVLGGEGHASCPMVSVFYCNVQGGQLRAYVNIAHECHEYMDYGLRWVNGNIDAAPCFAALGYWDTNGTSDEPNDDLWVDGDYHLKSQAGRWDTNPPSGDWVQDDVTSPCIDAGDPMSPIGLEPFPNGGRVNMGAYGGTAEASKSYFGKPPCETIIAGDINGDCKVDFKDIQLIALNWLEESQHGRR
jgi:predicted outer membrane repeat protein